MLVSALGQPEREFGALGEWEERGDGKHCPAHSGPKGATRTLHPHTPVMHILAPLSTPVTYTHTHTHTHTHIQPLPGPLPPLHGLNHQLLPPRSLQRPCVSLVSRGPPHPGLHTDIRRTAQKCHKDLVTPHRCSNCPVSSYTEVLLSAWEAGSPHTPPPLRARAPAESTSVCRKKHPRPWARRQLKVTWCPVNTRSTHTPTSAGILVIQGHDLRGHPKSLGVNPQKPSVIKANNILMQYLQKLNQQM